MIKHPYHIVDPRPWPITRATGVLLIVRGMARWWNKFTINLTLRLIGMVVLLITVRQWWRDVSREATLQGKHTHKVESGIRTGIILFIVREIFFFFAFFWAFFHSSLRSNVGAGAVWPPTGVNAIDPFGVPLLNTTVLLSSGASITWAHISLLIGNWIEAFLSLSITVGLGLFFTILQRFEYAFCPFSMSDSIYGSTFYLATGFHGLHVVIGTLFIIAMWGRLLVNHFSQRHHFGFEARAWYWHFVDVVWLFLYVCIYWWGF